MRGLLRKDFYLLWSYCRLMPLFLLAFIIFSCLFFGRAVALFHLLSLHSQQRPAGEPAGL